MATANPLFASNLDWHDRPSQNSSKATSLPHGASNPNEVGVSQRSTRTTTSRPHVASNLNEKSIPQNSPRATSLPYITSDANEDSVSQRSLKNTSLPHIASDANDDNNHLEKDTSQPSTLSTPSPNDDTTAAAAANWDTIDPATGLSNAYTTAISIIDSCDHTQLRRFNALLLADNPTLSVGQRIEMYYHHYGGGGESEEQHGIGQGQGERRRRKSVADRVAAVVAVWRRRKEGDRFTSRDCKE